MQVLKVLAPTLTRLLAEKIRTRGKSTRRLCVGAPMGAHPQFPLAAKEAERAPDAFAPGSPIRSTFMTPKEDPATPAFWDARFHQNRMPWDAGSTPADLEYYLTGKRGGRVLIPGCGSAYEARSFLEKGYEVVAIDFSQAAVERARAELGPWHTAVVLGDFFSHNFGARAFDIVYERAFLASLPRRMWAPYAARVAELLSQAEG